jgi:hypothetical protein
VSNVRLILNGVFQARDAGDATAAAMEARGRAALDSLPAALRGLERVDVPLLPFGLVGIDALRTMGADASGVLKDSLLSMNLSLIVGHSDLLGHHLL